MPNLRCKTFFYEIWWIFQGKGISEFIVLVYTVEIIVSKFPHIGLQDLEDVHEAVLSFIPFFLSVLVSNCFLLH